MFRFIAVITKVISEYIPLVSFLATLVVEGAKRIDDARQPKTEEHKSE